jgi:hypothetical protein
MGVSACCPHEACGSGALSPSMSCGATSASPHIRSDASRLNHNPSCSRARAQEGRGPSSETASCSQSRRRPPPAPDPAAPARSRGIGCRLGLQYRAFGDDALERVAPERDEKLAGERRDHNAPQPPLGLAYACVEPPAQGGVRLVAQPYPGGLDDDRPQALVACLRDALVAGDRATLPR